MSNEVERECLLAEECGEVHDLIHICSNELTAVDFREVDELGQQLCAVVNASPATNAVKVCAAWALLRIGVEKCRTGKNDSHRIQ